MWFDEKTTILSHLIKLAARFNFSRQITKCSSRFNHLTNFLDGKLLWRRCCSPGSRHCIFKSSSCLQSPPTWVINQKLILAHFIIITFGFEFVVNQIPNGEKYKKSEKPTFFCLPVSALLFVCFLVLNWWYWLFYAINVFFYFEFILWLQPGSQRFKDQCSIGQVSL